MDKAQSRYFNTARRMDEALISLLREKDFEYVTIKELCNRANVNRSTFYLHYENLGDLLLETIEMVNNSFQSSFAVNEISIENKDLDDLFFMTDEWLIPYLSFIRENKCVYKAIHTNPAAFGTEKAYYSFFKNVFSPILSRYGVSEEKHQYIMDFYRYGLTAITMRWVNEDCTRSVEYIADIIKIFFKNQNNTDDSHQNNTDDSL